MEKLTTTHVWIIFGVIFSLGAATAIGLSIFTDYDYHTIRGITGLVFVILCSPLMIWAQIYWWRMDKKIEEYKRNESNRGE